MPQAMPTFSVEEFVAMSKTYYARELLGRPEGQVIVRCYDGEVITTFVHIAFAYAYWEFNREYNVPVSCKQLLNFATDITEKVHMQLSRAALRTVDTALGGSIPLHVLAECEFKVNELQINTSIEHLEEYSMVIDAEDYYLLHSHPKIKAARELMYKKCSESPLSLDKYHAIRDAYQTFDDVVHDNINTTFLYNGLAGLIRCACTKLTQLHQGIVARGFESEVNSCFWADPVLASFVDGLKTPYSFAAETRSGAKAAMYTGDIMGDTEYLHRLVQMVAATFQRVHLMDCGSTVTYDFKVTERYLPFINGKYYLEDGVVKEVVGRDKTLIGKTLKFRFPGGCAISDRGGCCSVCCGAVSKAIPEGTNVGHTAATKYCGTGTQKVLSVKHDDLASLSSMLKIVEYMSDFLKLSKNGREIIYTGINHMKLAVKTTCCVNLGDVYAVPDVTRLPITEFSKIDQATFFDLSDGLDAMDITDSIGEGGEVVHFSPEFLAYIAEERTRLELRTFKRSDYYMVDLQRFPKGTPMFIAPFRHFDMITQHKATKAFLHSTRSGSTPRLTDFNNFGDAAKALLDLTMDKLGINLSVLELSIYAFTVSDTRTRDYRPVRHSNACEFLPMDDLYMGRSITAKLFAESQCQLLMSPLAITIEDRVSHPYDSMMM